MAEFTVPGNGELEELAIFNNDKSVGFDISTSYVSLSIVESIDNMSVRGVLRIADGTSMMIRLPVVGEEYVVVRWNTSIFEEDPREYTFRVSRVSNVTPSEDNEVAVYDLYLVSEYEYEQRYMHVSAAYSETFAEIAQKVYKEIETNATGLAAPLPLDVHHTDGIAEFIAPDCSPFKTLQLISGIAFSKEYPASLYTFYQNKSGFNFHNLAELAADKYSERESADVVDKRTFWYQPIHQTDTLELKAAFNIRSLMQLQRGENYDNSSRGHITNTVAELDYVTKQVNYTTQTVGSDLSQYGMFDNRIGMTDSFHSSYGQIPSETIWIYYDSSRKPVRQAEAAQNKRLFGKLFRSQMLALRVAGSSILTAGDMINIIINTTTGNSASKQDRDSQMSGYYMIKDITHIFTNNTYNCDIIAVRPGIEGFEE